ncbi:MAG TPA: MBL fold metallo-hydrolase [Candidatus Aminicenantes bacterium]|nr:MBL fold metallo-hydrolase [Candidatus Aminicenantes bacterium]
MTRFILTAVVLSSTVFLGGQTPPADPSPKPAATQPGPMTVGRVSGGLYLVKGGAGANAAFYVGEESVIVVDAKMTEEAVRGMLAEIARVTDRPVKFLILTHSDGDHVNGLPGFPGGLTIISSAATKAEMAAAFQEERSAGRRAFLPAETYEARLELIFRVPRGKTASVTLLELGPAHTGGDTIVVFQEEKAAFIGDLAFVGRDPLIHRSKGGTAAGYVAALKKMIELDGVETYLSGHADPLAKADLRALLSDLEEIIARVKALAAGGKSLEEVKAALLPPPLPDAPPSRWPSFVENAYLELTGKK